MAHSWDEGQTSSQKEEDRLIEGGSPPHGSNQYHEEDFELEDESPLHGKKRERACRKESDDSSSEEEPYEVIFEEEDEEGAGKKSGKIPIESVKIISAGDDVSFVKNTPTIMDSCGMDRCTIDGSSKDIKQENPIPHKNFTVSARIIV